MKPYCEWPGCMNLTTSSVVLHFTSDGTEMQWDLCVGHADEVMAMAHEWNEGIRV